MHCRLTLIEYNSMKAVTISPDFGIKIKWWTRKDPDCPQILLKISSWAMKPYQASEQTKERWNGLILPSKDSILIIGITNLISSGIHQLLNFGP